MKMIVLTVLLAAAGCKKGAVSDCEAAIGKGVDGMLESVKSRSASSQMLQNLTELTAKMKTALVQRCNEDKWSPDTVECFTKLSSRQEMQACEQKLTAEQRTKMRNDMRQIMTSMPMPGMPGHPPTLGSGAGGSGAMPAPGGAGAAPPGAPVPPPAAQSAPPAGGAAAPTPPAPPPAAPAAGSSASAPSGSGGW